MLKSYPVANQPDTREYVVALAGALALLPREIAAACAHPVTGVVRECMFKPTVAEITRWCEREAAPLFAELQRLDEAAAAANAPRTIDRSNRQTIDELRARYGPTFGLKRVDALDREPDDEERERRARTERAEETIERNRRAILAEYARMKLEPVIASDGTLISLALLRSLGRVPVPEQPR